MADDLVLEEGPSYARPDSTETWARVRAGLQAHVASKSKAPIIPTEDDDEEDDWSSITVIQPGVLVAVADLPQSGRLFAERAVAKGWKIHSSRSVTWHPDKLQKKDSTKTGVKAGELTKAAHETTHFCIRAYLPDGAGGRVAWFMLLYDFEGKNLFLGGHWWSSIVDEREFSKKVGAFEEWFSIFAPKPPPKTPSKPRAPEKSQDERLLDGEDWDG